MNFAEKLKNLRKQAGISQEQLAEKLGVSRQAVTKWETDVGIPDIGNIMAISAMFSISIDELLSNEAVEKRICDFLFESVTEYDISEQKRCDIKLGEARKAVLSGYEGEKLRVRLASNSLQTLQTDFKIRLDDIKRRIDVDLIRKNGATAASAKEGLYVFIQLPSPYAEKVECAVNAGEIELRALECDSVELDLKTPNVLLDGVTGTVEINCNIDMNIICASLNGAVELNQVSAASRIAVPEDAEFAVLTRGVATSVSFEKDGQPAEAFDTPEAGNLIELNGIKSELVISRLERED